MPAPTSSTAETAPLIAEAWAWLDAGNTGRFSASGGFAKSTTPSPSEASFYVNDFELSDAAPWRIPLNRTNSIPAACLVPAIAWEPPSRDRFRIVFNDLMDAVRDR